MPTFSVIMALTLIATFLSLVLAMGKYLDWEPWVLGVTMVAVATALPSIHLFSGTAFRKAQSISMLTLLVVTSLLLLASLLLAKVIGKGSKLSRLAFLAAIVTFLSIWLFA